MKGSVWSKLVLACFPCSELGENRYLSVGGLACLLEFIYKLVLLNLKWISESPQNMVNCKIKLWDLELGTMSFHQRYKTGLSIRL